MKKVKKSRQRILSEGDSVTVPVRQFMGDVGATLPRKILRYLKVRPGDKLQIQARSGVIEIAPVLTIEEEIAKYISQ